MSNHERWVVYPLIFLAIGMWFRDRVLPSHRPEISVGRLVAEEIEVKHLRAETLATANAVVKGHLEILGPDSRPLVLIGPVSTGPGNKLVLAPNGRIEFIGHDSQKIAVLTAEADGNAGLFLKSPLLARPITEEPDPKKNDPAPPKK